MLCGLVTPTTGAVAYLGEDLLGRGHLLQPRVSAVLEGARNIHWRLTVLENIDYTCRLHGLSEYQERSSHYVHLLGLGQYANTECRYLSRGNQQKVALACALTLNAEILLLDEPTLGLDMEVARTIMSAIRREKEKQRIVIVTTHDAEFIELAADEIVLFKEGSVTPLGSPEKIVAQYGDRDQRFSTAYLNYIKN
jgi:ABC-2 type transport system ATP-binding protein